MGEVIATPNKSVHDVALDNLLTQAVDAAREAGKAVMEVYASHFSVELKEDKSPLTLADKRSHEIIVQRLSRVKGGPLPVLSEEGKVIPYGVRKGWEYFWLVDPLDGTKEFIKRNGEFTVNIALIRGHRPVLGVIFVPVTEALYFAYEGSGAYREIQGRKVKLPEQQTRDRFSVAGSRSHATEELAMFVEEMKRKYGEINFISAGSSLKFCLVAEGKADVYPRFGPTMEWDTAAGQAIAEQSGVSVVAMDTKRPLLYNKQSLLNPWFMVSRIDERWSGAGEHGAADIRR
jgi:3'(2'), 5'-bisphosphate nucleotidase